MATIDATGGAGVQPRGLRVGLVAVTRIYSLSVSLSVGDVIQMIKVPAGAAPVYVSLSNGSGQGVVDVGDGVMTNRYINGYLCSATSVQAVINRLYVPYVYSTDDTIDIYVSAVSTGAASGGFNMMAIFSMNAPGAN